jgi:hypothetical protein
VLARLIARLIVGALCGVTAGSAVLYLFSLLSYLLGLVSIHAIGAAESLDAVPLIVAAAIGGLAALPERRWRAALVSVVVHTLLFLAAHLIFARGAYQSASAFLAGEALFFLVHALLGGAAFGLVVNATSSWVLSRLEADWAATKRLYTKRPPPPPETRPEQDRIYEVDR